MTSTTAITNVAPSVPVTPATAAPVTTTSLNAQVVLKPISSQTVSISPRIIDDPTAGIITQYLDSSGKVASQFPSTTVVAYLRAGLTPEGLSRHAANGTVA